MDNDESVAVLKLLKENEALQARVKELLDSKQHEFKCFQEVNSELTEVREENARLRKVVDAARAFLTIGNSGSEIAKNFAGLLTALSELGTPPKGVTSPSEGVDGEKNCSDCELLGKWCGVHGGNVADKN